MDHDLPAPGFWKSRHAIGLCVIGVVAAYFLLTEHLAHVLGALPFLLLAACPLMHVFMHHDHAHGHAQAEQGTPDSAQGAHAAHGCHGGDSTHGVQPEDAPPSVTNR